MKKLILSLIVIISIISFTPLHAAGSQSKSFSASPAGGSFTGTNTGNQPGFGTSFNVSTIPTDADIQIASLTLSQSSAAQTPASTFDLVDDASSVTLGTKTLAQSATTHTFSGLAELVRGWVTTPSSNQGVTFSSSSLDPDDNISLASITLNVTYFVEDNTTPLITSVKVSSISANSVKITWTTNEATLGFVDYGLTTGYGLAVAGNDYITGHAVSIIGLKADTTYHYRVRGKDSSGNESLTGDFTFKTVSDGSEEVTPDDTDDSPGSNLLLPPEDLQFDVEEVNGGFIVILSWNKSQSEEIDGYRVYRSVEERFPIELYIQLDEDILTFTDEGVEKDKTYYYLVRAYSGEEESSDSNEQVVKVNEVTSISKIPIKDLGQSFWISLGIVNAVAMGVILGTYFLIKKVKLEVGKRKDNAKTPETLVHLSRRD